MGRRMGRRKGVGSYKKGMGWDVESLSGTGELGMRMS
jgi:hypothetical protein